MGARRLPDHQCGLDDTRWACVHRVRCLRPIAIDDGDVPPFPYPWTNGSGGVRAFRHRDCAMGHRRQACVVAGRIAAGGHATRADRLREPAALRGARVGRIGS
jgi:hypothetical protein